MSRLAADIDLLTRAATIAAMAIWPQPNIAVSAETLRLVAEEVETQRGRPADYVLIRDEAVWLMQAARNVVLYREDGNAAMIARWTRLAELLAANVALDLENARKSVAEVG